MQSAAKSPSVSEPDHLAANRFHMRRFTRHSGGLRPCLLVPPSGIASKTKLMHTPCRESPVKKALCTARHTDHLHSPPQALQSRHSPSADHRWKFEHIQPLYRDLSLRVCVPNVDPWNSPTPSPPESMRIAGKRNGGGEGGVKGNSSPPHPAPLPTATSALNPKRLVGRGSRPQNH